MTRYDRLGASSRLRFFQLFPALQRCGITVCSAPLLDDSYLRRRYGRQRPDVYALVRTYSKRVVSLLKSRQFDVIWLEKEAFPWLPGLWERIPGLMRIPYVVDYDDATFHMYDQHPRRVVRFALGGKIGIVMRNAATVVVGNAYLGRYAASAGAAKIVEVPTVVDTGRYGPGAFHSRESPLRVGWIGSPSTAKYLDNVREPLQELARLRAIQLVVVGAPQFRISGVPIELHPWRESTEVASIRSFDVGIMPLPDEAWARGKCGYKLLQYMACGLPTVASPTGVNSSIVEPGITGFLASTTADWIDSLRALKDDVGLRHRLGRAGREKAVNHFSLGVAVPVLATTLRQARR